MPKRRRKSSEDKTPSDCTSSSSCTTKGVNVDMRERCEDLMRRIKKGDDGARLSYASILSDIETKLMAELDSDTLNNMVRLLLSFMYF